MTKGINIQAATANCGNDTLGDEALSKLISEADMSGLMIVNCQEVNLEKTMEKLEKKLIGTHLSSAHSELRKTFTKVEWSVVTGSTGMASIVIFDKTKIKAVQFNEMEKKEAAGKNSNKGATINTVLITDMDGHNYPIQTIAGHLESNSDQQRVEDWRKIRSQMHPKVDTFDELNQVIPSAVVAGYDANTRSIVSPSSPDASTVDVVNLWREPAHLDSKIAPFVLGRLGDEVFSEEDTYKFKLKEGSPTKVLKEDKKRPGYANAGSLDFVSLQNNTSGITNISPSTENHHYQKAKQNIPIEENSRRDHNIIVSDAIHLNPNTDKFTQIRNHICKQLTMTAPVLSKDLSTLTDTSENRKTLLTIYNNYLAPNGVLDKMMVWQDSRDVKSPISDHTLHPRSASDFSAEQLSYFSSGAGSIHPISPPTPATPSTPTTPKPGADDEENQASANSSIDSTKSYRDILTKLRPKQKESQEELDTTPPEVTSQKHP